MYIHSTEFDIYQLMTFLYNNVLVCNINIKTLKTLQNISISIQIILKELVVSSLKSLILILLHTGQTSKIGYHNNKCPKYISMWQHKCGVYVWRHTYTPDYAATLP
jgi:hypothetical protein